MLEYEKFELATDVVSGDYPHRPFKIPQDIDILFKAGEFFNENKKLPLGAAFLVNILERDTRLAVVTNINSEGVHIFTIYKINGKRLNDQTLPLYNILKWEPEKYTPVLRVEDIRGYDVSDFDN